MKLVCCALFTILTIAHVYAGEIAAYRIVGISGDSQYLAFSEYGINNQNKLFSSVFIVNIPQNSFVSDGIFKNTYGTKIQIDQDGTNALLYSVVQATPALKKYRINMLNSGKLVYVLLNGNKPFSSISFTDYDTNISYAAVVHQKSRTTEGTVESAFNIDIKITDGENVVSKTVGLPNYYRKNVTKYLVRAIYTTDDNSSLIFAIEKRMKPAADTGTNIHYMVETLTWR